jgi:hypothetical protein
MNDPRTPYHAISAYDAFGQIPFVSKLPREEEDFATIAEARDWLVARGGGRLERYAERGAFLYSSETVAPPQAADTAYRS